MRLLILGGTSEASELARALSGDARFDTTMSLAGRTRHPAPQPVPTRLGGFGGAEGLARHLVAERIELLIDATHPFAVRISRNAAIAAARCGIPLLSVQRPEWQPSAGDNWIVVRNVMAAVEALGKIPRVVFLTIGQKDLAPFAAAPWHHYVIRTVDPPPPDLLPSTVEMIAVRGPFQEADERRLLAERQIDILVTKNSGGSGTAAKLRAARALALPVVMVARPAPPQVCTAVSDAAGALAWLMRLHAALSVRGV
jgi:precorrin-6A/cobalt-precorrin-6A reductase